MNKETLEVIRKMESEMIKAISAVAEELEREVINQRPIASNCETNAAKELLGRLDNSFPLADTGFSLADNGYLPSFLRKTIELLIVTNQRINKLEAQNGKA
jgi:hypothetical protein